MKRDKLIYLVLIGVWSTLIFEIGFSYFKDVLGVTLFNLFTISLILLFLFDIVTRKITLEIQTPSYIKRVFLVYLIYWFISLVGVLYSPVKSIAFTNVLSYLIYTLILIITIIYFNNMRYKSIVIILRGIGWVSLATLSLLTLITLNTGMALNSLSERQRFSISPFDDYNVFVYSLILSVLLLLLKREENNKTLIVYTILMLFIILIGVLSGSRRSITIYGPVSLIIPFLLLWIKGSYKRVFVLVIPLFIIIGVGINVITNLNVQILIDYFNLPTQAAIDLQQRFSRGTSFVENASIDTSSRSGRWEEAQNIINGFNWTEIVIGEGTRSFFANDAFIRQGGGKDSPHNFILSAFIEGGLIKIIIVFVFIFIFTFIILKNIRTADFWTSIFLLVSFSAWILTTLISGLEFFYSKQFILILLISYFSYFREEVPYNELEKSSTCYCK